MLRNKHLIKAFQYALFYPLLFSFSNISIANDNYKLPNVPYPVENKPSEAKRILGKILFWDEQLSTDNSIACGSCHLPSANGSDKRLGAAPGYDNQLNTKDDIFGSQGVVHRNNLGQAQPHPIFNQQVQVTGRSAQPYFLGLWAKSNFWDGRAVSEFIDPETYEIAIRTGGALENQALGPIMSDVEMAKQGQLIEEVIHKLTYAKPLALATKHPQDMAAALAKNPTYPALFSNAFGDSHISFKRIAFAIATYERSLVPDQTPWDLAHQGKQTLSFQENLGFEFFKTNGCAQCHKPPLFTDNKFYNIGIQGRNADKGHQLISQNKNDVGAMKTPSLRNVGLKATFMHTGQFNTLEEVIDAYADVPFKQVATKLPDGEKYDFQFTETQRKAIIAFLTKSLTDPRVASETYPFDRPRLRQESPDTGKIQALEDLTIQLTNDNLVKITWFNNLPAGSDIEIIRNDGRHYWLTKSPFIDLFSEAGKTYQYELWVRNNHYKKSSAQRLTITTASAFTLGYLLITLLGLTVLIYLKRNRKLKLK